MTEFETLLSDVRAWHLRVFGKPCNPKRTILKVREEVGELHDEIIADNLPKTMNEIVDVLLATLNIAAELLHDADPPGDLLDGIRVKMGIVERRDQVARDRERGIE